MARVTGQELESAMMEWESEKYDQRLRDWIERDVRTLMSETSDLYSSPEAFEDSVQEIVDLGAGLDERQLASFLELGSD